MQSSIFLLNGAMRITLVNVIYKSNLVIPRYLQYINQDLIPGEKVTQAQHAQQAAELARAAGHPPHVLVGALLHDIGHLSGGVLGGFDHSGHPYYWCISFMQNNFQRSPGWAGKGLASYDRGRTGYNSRDMM